MTVGRRAGRECLTASVDGESRTLWPSDHAGVVATLRTGATGSTGTEPGTPASTSRPDAGATESGDGDTRDTGASPPGTGMPPTRRSTETFAEPPNGSSSGGANTEAGADADGDAESETATDTPGFGPLAGLVGVLGGAAELARRRRGRE